MSAEKIFICLNKIERTLLFFSISVLFFTSNAIGQTNPCAIISPKNQIINGRGASIAFVLRASDKGLYNIGLFTDGDKLLDQTFVSADYTGPIKGGFTFDSSQLTDGEYRFSCKIRYMAKLYSLSGATDFIGINVYTKDTEPYDGDYAYINVHDPSSTDKHVVTVVTGNMLAKTGGSINLEFSRLNSLTGDVAEELLLYDNLTGSATEETTFNINDPLAFARVKLNLEGDGCDAGSYFNIANCKITMDIDFAYKPSNACISKHFSDIYRRDSSCDDKEGAGYILTNADYPCKPEDEDFNSLRWSGNVIYRIILSKIDSGFSTTELSVTTKDNILNSKLDLIFHKNENGDFVSNPFAFIFDQTDAVQVKGLSERLSFIQISREKGSDINYVFSDRGDNFTTDFRPTESNEEIHDIVANTTIALLEEIASLPADAQKEKENKIQAILKSGQIIIPVLMSLNDDEMSEVSEEILSNFKKISVYNTKEAMEGLSYFNARKAVYFVAYGLNSNNMDIQINTTDMLREYPSSEALQYLVDALERNRNIVFGNEDATIHQMLQRTLVDAITNMIAGDTVYNKNRVEEDKLRFATPEEIEDTIVKGRNYLKTNNINNTVDKVNN